MSQHYNFKHIGHLGLVFLGIFLLFAHSHKALAHTQHGTEDLKNSEVLIVNPYVTSQINSTFESLTSINGSPLGSDVFEFLSLKDQTFTKHLQTYHKASHELGVCGGYVQAEKSDLPRLQKNMALQRAKHIKESQQAFNFQKSKSPFIVDMLTQVSHTNFESDLQFITSFPHRLARVSKNTEIQSIYEYILKQLPSDSDSFTHQLVSHRRTPQKSIHIQVLGKNPNRHIVVGAHIDSINLGWGSQNAPGADDNASGSSALIQMLRTILENNYQPQNTLDFFWYAGEESGLIGSGEIAKNYSQNSFDVIAALQLDMLGVPDRHNNIFLEQDFSSPKLNQLLIQTAQTYLPDLQIKNSSCGYPCSDHSSWYHENYPVVFPTSGNLRSSDFNHRIHTARDTPDTIDWLYAINVTKLGLAFVLNADQQL